MIHEKFSPSTSIASLLSVQTLINEMAQIQRRHYHPGTSERENDIEHSFGVAMLCWRLHADTAPHLDLGTILKYALVHDFVERYAGDTNTFASSDERLNKRSREQAALSRLQDEYGDFEEMVALMASYELRQDPEALYVWTVDKMQALILGSLDDWRPFREHGISYESFMQKHNYHIDRGAPECQLVYRQLLCDLAPTYYDQPS